MSMRKYKQVQAANLMLRQLQSENEQTGGFNEFPQFCEDTLIDILSYLNEEGLEKLISCIENTSRKGIHRPFIETE